MKVQKFSGYYYTEARFILVKCPHHGGWWATWNEDGNDCHYCTYLSWGIDLCSEGNCSSHMERHVMEDILRFFLWDD